METIAFAARIRVFSNPLFQLRNTHPLGLIHLKTFLNELFRLFGDRDALPKPHRHSSHFIDELAFGFTLPRSLPMQQLINDDAYRPDVVLDRIDVLLQGFRGHIKRTAHIVLLLFKR